MTQTDGDLRKVFLCHLADHLVNFAVIHYFDGRMAGHFAQDTTVTAADHNHVLRRGVGAHRKVGNHLLVPVFVALGDLDYAIKAEHDAVSLGPQYDEVLKIGFNVQQDLFNLQRHGLAWPHFVIWADLCVPSLNSQLPQ